MKEHDVPHCGHKTLGDGGSSASAWRTSPAQNGHCRPI